MTFDGPSAVDELSLCANLRVKSAGCVYDVCQLDTAVMSLHWTDVPQEVGT